MALTLEEANQVVEGAIARGRELGIKLSVAVCDEGGRLLAFSRMDGACGVGGGTSEQDEDCARAGVAALS